MWYLGRVDNPQQEGEEVPPSPLGRRKLCGNTFEEPNSFGGGGVSSATSLQGPRGKVEDD